MKHTSSWGPLAALLAVVLVAGCGEKPQTAQARKSDTSPYQGVQAADAGNSASGWQAGDRASWEQQLRTRAQGQNEYTRAAAP